MKCKKCKYYYRTMASEQGYNPYPYCHYYEETQKRPNILTQECFHKRAANNRPQIKEAIKMFEIEMNDNVQYMVIEPLEFPEREIQEDWDI